MYDGSDCEPEIFPLHLRDWMSAEKKRELRGYKNWASKQGVIVRARELTNRLETRRWFYDVDCELCRSQRDRGEYRSGEDVVGAIGSADEGAAVDVVYSVLISSV